MFHAGRVAVKGDKGVTLLSPLFASGAGQVENSRSAERNSTSQQRGIGTPVTTTGGRARLLSTDSRMEESFHRHLPIRTLRDTTGFSAGETADQITTAVDLFSHSTRRDPD
jgi:hypothetical protein